MVADGLIQCAVYSESSPPPTSTSSIISQNNIALVSGLRALLNITGLTPSTLYDVYCTSTSLRGVQLPLTQSLHLPSVQTDCCRRIFVSLLSTSLLQGSTLLNAVSISMDAPPSRGTFYLLLSTQPQRNTTIVGTTPALLAFSNSIKSSIAQVSFSQANTQQPGLNFLTVSIFNDTAHAYEIVYLTPTGSNPSYTVLTVNQPVPAPLLSSASFSSSGNALTITLDSNSNQKASSQQFPCTSFLSFPGAFSTKCQWSSPSSITALLGSQASVLIGDSLVLLADSLTAQCQGTNKTFCAVDYPSNPTSAVLISGPSTPLTPIVSISAASTISQCDFLALDMTSSQGSGGRAWTSVSFSLTGPDPVVCSTITNYLNNFPEGFKFSPPTPIPGTLFGQLTGTYTFFVTLTNFLGVSSFSSVNVHFTMNTVPMVTILGSPLTTITRTSPITFYSDYFVSVCSSLNGTIVTKNSRSDIQTSWSISSSQDIPMSGVSSYSKQSNAFKLSPQVLTPLSTYTVKFTAKYTPSNITSSTSVQVYVTQGDLIASIAGGYSQGVKYGLLLTLDGSASYDSDVPELLSAAPGLSFSWKCTQISPVISSHCGLTPFSNSLIGKLPTLTFGTNRSQVGDVSLIVLTVFDSTRSSQASVEVTILSADAPIIQLVSSPTSKVNTFNPLALAVSVSSVSAGSCEWSVDSNQVSLGSASLTPLSQSLKAGASNIIMSLALVANSLPVGSRLRFMLTCSTFGSSVATATMLVNTNEPPLPGLFLTVPSKGIELNTTFTLSATNWQDVDLPLSFSFGFMSTQGIFQTVQGSSQLSYATTLLPAGPQPHQEVTILSQISDCLQAFSTASSRATVNPVPSQVLENVATKLLDAASQSKSIDFAKQALSTVGASLNAVSCVGAPECSLLNRESCFATTNTCGSCLDGYIGDAGDGNSPCLDPSFFHRRLFESCNSTGDCSLGFICNGGQCVLGPQSCLSVNSLPCSGHGTCNFIQNLDGSLIPFCALGDPRCSAQCDCDEGFEGSSCSYRDVDLKVRQDLRLEMLSVLSGVMATEDPDGASIIGWLNSLTSISKNLDEIHSTSLSFLSEELMDILNHSISAAIPYHRLLPSLNLIDSTLLLSQRNSSSLSRDVLETQSRSMIQSFSTLLLDQMVSDQFDMFYLQSQFKMMFTSMREDSSYVLSTPLSLNEAQYQMTPSQITITNLTSSNFVKMSLGVINSSPSNSNGLNSNPLLLQFDQDTLCSAANGCRISLNLQNTFSIPFQEGEDPQVTYTTECDGSSNLTEYYCPTGGFSVAQCPVDQPGVLTSTCPWNSSQPACVLFPGSGSSGSQDCELISFTDSSVSCECSFQALSSSSSSSPLPSPLPSPQRQSSSLSLSSYPSSSHSSMNSFVFAATQPSSSYPPKAYFTFISAWPTPQPTNSPITTFLPTKPCDTLEFVISLNISFQPTVLSQSKDLMPTKIVSTTAYFLDVKDTFLLPLFNSSNSSQVHITTSTSTQLSSTSQETSTFEFLFLTTSNDYPSYLHHMREFYDVLKKKLASGVNSGDYSDYLLFLSSLPPSTPLVVSISISSPSINGRLLLDPPPTTFSHVSPNPPMNLTSPGYIALWVVLSIALPLGAYIIGHLLAVYLHKQKQRAESILPLPVHLIQQDVEGAIITTHPLSLHPLSQLGSDPLNLPLSHPLSTVLVTEGSPDSAPLSLSDYYQRGIGFGPTQLPSSLVPAILPLDSPSSTNPSLSVQQADPAISLSQLQWLVQQSGSTLSLPFPRSFSASLTSSSIPEPVERERERGDPRRVVPLREEGNDQSIGSESIPIPSLHASILPLPLPSQHISNSKVLPLNPSPLPIPLSDPLDPPPLPLTPNSNLDPNSIDLSSLSLSFSLPLQQPLPPPPFS